MVESCSSSSQALYRSFPCRHEKLTHAAVLPLPKKSFDFSGSPFSLFISPIFQVHAFRAERCFGKMTKQKEPITQNIRNRREHGSRFKVMFYVIGSEKSKSGSALYSPCQQNQWRGGAVRHFRCTDTVSDKTDSHKICLNISIFSFCVDKLSTTLLYKQRPQLSRFADGMLAGAVVSFYKIR